MSERRRRRLEEESGGGLPLFPLVLVVILAGLLMGGLLAHFFGGSKSEARSAPAAVAIMPSPVVTPAPIPTSPRPQATPIPSPSATPRSTGSPAATPSQTPAPKRLRKSVTVIAAARAKSTQTPQSLPPTPSRTPAQKPIATVAATHTAAPHASAAAASTDDRAASLVRSYLQALEHGDRSGAAAYLASGAPSETFMTPDSHIESIRSSSLGAQQYRVTADVQTASGEYYVTFTVEQSPGGLAITDHYSIKPQ
jgi:outer membrane biosynthesis protein TonB